MRNRDVSGPFVAGHVAMSPVGIGSGGRVCLSLIERAVAEVVAAYHGWPTRQDPRPMVLMAGVGPLLRSIRHLWHVNPSFPHEVALRLQ
jgi:hypothetical protein